MLSTLRRSISSPNAWLSWTATRDGRGQLTLTGVAVEKLLPTKFAKIKLRQETLQSIFSGRLDIFYPPNFGCLGRKASFSTATGVSTSVRRLFAPSLRPKLLLRSDGSGPVGQRGVQGQVAAITLQVLNPRPSPKTDFQKQTSVLVSVPTNTAPVGSCRMQIFFHHLTKTKNKSPRVPRSPAGRVVSR